MMILTLISKEATNNIYKSLYFTIGSQPDVTWINFLVDNL